MANEGRETRMKENIRVIKGDGRDNCGSLSSRSAIGGRRYSDSFDGRKATSSRQSERKNAGKMREK